MGYTLNTGVYAALIAFAASVVICPLLIPYLTKLKFGQYIRDDGPKEHIKKQGTPTMGGIMIVLSFIIGSLIFLNGNREGLMVIFVTICFGTIGFLDDYIKITRKRSLGLRAYQKLIGQFIVTTIFLLYLLGSHQNYFNTLGPTEIIIPFLKNYKLNLGYLYIPFVYIVMLGTVNGVNLTDGLDGLAAGVTALVTTFFLFAAWVAGSDTVPMLGAAAGSLLGFLLFNAHPAKVFMGDTGSLALGGFVASVALILKMPLFIVIVGVIYLIESLSTMIQVGWFKTTGKRFFKMAPIHHSFELSGWAETKIVALFYIITAVFCLIGYLAAQFML